jgi:hypothetical protein
MFFAAAGRLIYIVFSSIINGREDRWLQPSIPWKILNERLPIPRFAKNKGIISILSLEGLQPYSIVQQNLAHQLHLFLD